VELPRKAVFTYLGIERDASGLRMDVYLERVVARAERELRRMRACGFGWSPATRLALFRAFCRSTFEYGGALLAIWASGDVKRYEDERWLRLHGVVNEAHAWICGVQHKERWNQLFASITGDPILFDRLQYLVLSLAIHIGQSDASSPIQELWKSKLPRSNQDYLHWVKVSLVHQDYVKAARVHLRQTESTLRPAAFYRKRMQELYLDQDACSAWSTYILPCSRRPTLQDNVLSLPSSDRRTAVAWRLGVWNTVRTGALCCKCGQLYTRSCIEHMLEVVGLARGVVAIDDLYDDWHADFQLHAANFTLKRYTLVDHLIGHRDKLRQDTALATLRLWDSRMVELKRLKGLLVAAA
jgi:hypothetical protein